MLYYYILKSATAMSPAPEGAPNSQGHVFIMLLFYAGLFAIFYFLLIRPQMKRNKDIGRMQDSLTKGDSILTTGGIYATVHKIKEDTVTLEIAEGVRIKVQKSAISEKVKDSRETNGKNSE